MLWLSRFQNRSRTLLVSAGALFVGACASPRPSLACDCAPLSVEEAFDLADSVALGEVITIEEVDETSIRAEIRVTSIWKGVVAAELRISTADDSASCGVPFATGEEWLIYSRYPEGYEPQCELSSRFLNTHLCTRTSRLPSEDIEALGPPLWIAPPRAFLRGDANGDGEIEISDAVRALRWLFSGGEAPDCADSVDANDDGGIDVADPIFTLRWLFAGGPEPPAPGPVAAGFDATTDDEFVCGDETPPPCNASSKSSLGGVRVEWVEGPCSLTLAEAAAGVTFTYRLVVERPVDQVTTTALATCRDPAPGGLFLLEEIEGEKEHYCLCDLGFCPVRDVVTNLEPGSYAETFTWCGRNWFGPSDFFNPVGDPFPPGRYRITVHGEGTRNSPEGPEEPWAISASYEFDLER